MASGSVLPCRQFSDWGFHQMAMARLWESQSAILPGTNYNRREQTSVHLIPGVRTKSARPCFALVLM
jgi:hypothetical protein